MALLKPRRWLGYTIEVNDLIADAEEIIDRFASSEIPLADTFGSSSNPPERPRSVILCFGPGTEPARFAELLDLLPIASIHFIQASSDVPNRKVIYIGSYNSDAKPVAPVSSELLASLRSVSTPEELTRLVQEASSVIPLTVRS